MSIAESRVWAVVIESGVKANPCQVSKIAEMASSTELGFARPYALPGAILVEIDGESTMTIDVNGDVVTTTTPAIAVTVGVDKDGGPVYEGDQVTFTDLDGVDTSGTVVKCERAGAGYAVFRDDGVQGTGPLNEESLSAWSIGNIAVETVVVVRPDQSLPPALGVDGTGALVFEGDRVTFTDEEGRLAVGFVVACLSSESEVGYAVYRDDDRSGGGPFDSERSLSAWLLVNENVVSSVRLVRPVVTLTDGTRLYEGDRVTFVDESDRPSAGKVVTNPAYSTKIAVLRDDGMGGSGPSVTVGDGVIEAWNILKRVLPTMKLVTRAYADAPADEYYDPDEF